MIAVIDSTVVIHLYSHAAKMKAVLKQNKISQIFITRVNYLEILAGASENAKPSTRKFLQQFKVLEFNIAATKTASNLAMKYRVSSKQSKDFLIAATCIAYNLPLLTENKKDFSYAELKRIDYNITKLD